MIPINIPNLAGNEEKYLVECVRSNFVSSLGQFVTRFEKEVASLSGLPYAVATSSGTCALHLALRSVGVGPGDLVAVPSFTFIATANAISHCGAKPWLFDCETARWTLSAEQLESALARAATFSNGVLMHKTLGRRIAAIVPVYSLGNTPDMAAVGHIARQFDLPVVADAAPAIGIRDCDKVLSGARDLLCFSFNGNKTVTCGGGGMILGSNCDLLQNIRHTASTARASTDYDYDQVGYNYRMTNLQAAVGCAQLERLEQFLQRKHDLRRRYSEAVAELPDCRPFPALGRNDSTFWVSGLMVDHNAPFGAARLCEGLQAAGIEARPFWKPVHLQKPYYGCPIEDMATTANIWDRIIALPSSTGITDEEVNSVLAALRTVCSTLSADSRGSAAIPR